MKICILFICLLVGLMSTAQEFLCGNNTLESSLFSSEAEYATHVESINENYQVTFQFQQALGSMSVDTFNLVFHVIHQGEPIGTGANLDDAQILSTVEGLNRDFRALPIHDSIAISPYGTDSEIAFRPACLDPIGNLTNGIVRIDGSTIPNFATDGIQISTPIDGGNVYDVMNLSRWPEEEYINVYITHGITVISNGNSIGAAGMGPISQWWQHGIGAIYLTPTTVGVDIDGSLGYTISNPYGKLPSHEMGHFFGLWHTFQGMSCIETDCNIQGDGICDTEPHDNSSPFPMDTTCYEFHECATREPVENLMNYAGQSCGHVFTPGQKAKMKQVINDHLGSLVNLSDCSIVSNLTENSSGVCFHILPNPVEETLTIKADRSAIFKIIQLGGQQMVMDELRTGVNHFSVSAIPPGVYLLEIGDGRYSETQRIIIK